MGAANSITKPLVVTGHGRSGTHWLTFVLEHFLDARHEPQDYREGGDIIVDCRLWSKVDELLKEGYRVKHLVRDGRNVVRSTHAFYHGQYDFETLCREWAGRVDACQSLETIRVEDLIKPLSRTRAHTLPKWQDWPDDMTDTFWRVCGDQMRRHGYE